MPRPQLSDETWAEMEEKVRSTMDPGVVKKLGKKRALEINLAALYFARKATAMDVGALEAIRLSWELANRAVKEEPWSVVKELLERI